MLWSIGCSEDGVFSHLGRLNLSGYTVTDMQGLLMRSLMEKPDKQKVIKVTLDTYFSIMPYINPFFLKVGYFIFVRN